ncbi:MAG: flagellar export chaperone FlgN [Desulfovibrionaceae bacterium]
MFDRIKENLSRQGKAMVLLRVLLEEEFSRLLERDSKGVSPIELSLQELMRQLVKERLSLAELIQAGSNGACRRVREVMPGMQPEQAEDLGQLLVDLDELEQSCARQAACNQQLSLALYEQSRQLLEFMHERIKPTKLEGYSAKGKYANKAGESVLVRGTL